MLESKDNGEDKKYGRKERRWKWKQKLSTVCGTDQNSDPDPGCIYNMDTTGSLDPDTANLAMNLKAGFSFKGFRFHRDLACSSWRSKTKI